MELSTFIAVAVLSTLLAIVWHIIFYIYPAYKRLKIAKALVTLSKCVRAIDEGPLLDGTISRGGYIHDNIYKLIHGTLTSKVNLRFKMLKKLSINDKYIEDKAKFNAELNALDEETRRLIDTAMFSIARIMIFRDPAIFILACLKVKRNGNGTQKGGRALIRKRMISSTEAIAVNAKDADYSWNPC